MNLVIEVYGTVEVEVDKEEYELAIVDGQLDHFLDSYVSDIQHDITVLEPNGRLRTYPSGALQN